MFHMKIASVKSKGRKSEVYHNYSVFPIKPVAHFKLTTEDGVRAFIEIHLKLLKWAWLVYAKEYIMDIRALDSTRGARYLSSWSAPWQKAVEQCERSIYIWSS